MKLYEKIRHIRQNVLKISLKDFHKKLAAIFGDNTLTYYTLCRLERGHIEDIRIKSLYQISTALGVSLKELKEGTEDEESKVASIIRRKDRQEKKFIYNEMAYAEVMSPKELEFLAMEMVLLPGGKTKLEQDPIENIVYKKLMIVKQGMLKAHIGEEIHTLKKGDSLAFKSSIPHYFENPAKEKARCIIIQNPKSY